MIAGKSACRLALAVAIAALPFAARAQQTARIERPPTAQIRASKIVLVGDSTTQVLSGWGGNFCATHVTSALACVNLARGGRSSYSYRAEGSWALALGEMKTPGFAHTWVLIQFGHNDQPGKPGRSTDLATEFPANLKRYVEEARAAGAEPVLLTPLTRRQFKGGTLDRDLEPWAEAVRTVAAELHVPLIDLNRHSADVIEALGPALANRFAQVPPTNDVAMAALEGRTIAQAAPPPAAAPATATAPSVPPADPLGQSKLAFDYTHLGPVGAEFFSAMVAADLARTIPALRPLLIP